PAGQALPQDPQFAGSDDLLTQVVPQQVSLPVQAGSQIGGAHPQSGSFGTVSTLLPQPATDATVHALGVKVLPSTPLLHGPGFPSPPKIQIQLARPAGLPPRNAPPTQTSPGGAVSTSRQP